MPDLDPDCALESLSHPAFVSLALSNPVNAELLRRLQGLALPQCHLTAGCLFQALWNQRSGRAVDWGVKDHDIFYFDDTDRSWSAEDRVIRQVNALTADLGVTVEVKNQARVHLWYRERFQADYPQLQSARDGIDRYLVACTCVGIEVATGALYAPHGLGDLCEGVLRMNPKLPHAELFLAKAGSYQQRWPWLRCVTHRKSGFIESRFP